MGGATAPWVLMVVVTRAVRVVVGVVQGLGRK